MMDAVVLGDPTGTSQPGIFMTPKKSTSLASCSAGSSRSCCSVCGIVVW